jgi:hypothetical protein
MAGLVGCLAAAGMWTLTVEQHERSTAPSPDAEAVATTARRYPGSTKANKHRRSNMSNPDERRAARP